MILRPVLGQGSCLAKLGAPSRCESLLAVTALPLEPFAGSVPSVPVTLDRFELLAQSFDRSFLFSKCAKRADPARRDDVAMAPPGYATSRKWHKYKVLDFRRDR